MNSILRRRRALMGAQKSRPLYELKNQTVTRGQQYSSLVAPFAKDKACTILFDFTNTENPTSTPADRWKPIMCYDAGASLYALMIGKASSTSSNFIAWFFIPSSGDAVAVYPSSPTAGRHRIAITHNANSNSATLKYKEDNGSVVTVNLSSTYQDSNAILNFGGAANGGHSLPAGTINLAQVWDRILTADEINTFMGAQ
jgi:hypothetical protein